MLKKSLTNLTEILSLLPSLQGLLLIGIFVTFYKAKKSYKYALLYIVVLSFINISEYLGNLHIYSISVYSYYLLLFFVLISCPVFYLYILSLIKERLNIKNKAFIHLIIPTLVSVTSAVLFFLVPHEEKLMLIEGDYPISEPVSIYLQYYINLYLISNTLIYYLLVFVYSGLIIYKIIEHRKKIKEQFSELSEIKLNWVVLVVALTFAYTVWDIYLFFNRVYIDFQDYYLLFKFIYIFLFGIFAFRQKEVYVEDETVDEQEIDINPEDVVFNKIISCMEDEKMYLYQNLCLKDIAKAVNIHKNVLSKIINSRLNMNFFAWVNSYRIQEAKRLLESRENDKYTIDAIGELSGFKSKSAFYPQFKANTGKTPMEYRNMKL